MFLNIVHSSFVHQGFRTLCECLRKFTQRFRKLSGIFLTASSICGVDLGARTEVKGPDGSRLTNFLVDEFSSKTWDSFCVGTFGQAAVGVVDSFLAVFDVSSAQLNLKFPCL